MSLDNQLRDSFRNLLWPSILLASIVSFSCLRNFSLSMIVFFAAFGASACSIAIVPLFGIKFGGLMAIIPALVYILATSGSIHLIHYSLDAIGDSRKLLSNWLAAVCCLRSHNRHWHVVAGPERLSSNSKLWFFLRERRDLCADLSAHCPAVVASTVSAGKGQAGTCQPRRSKPGLVGRSRFHPAFQTIDCLRRKLL